MGRVAPLLALALLQALAPAPAHAAMELAPGFTARVYVTGAGFGPGGTDAPGMPSAASLAIDDAGVLYLARPGRRYATGEQEDLSPLYRIPPGGARLTPQMESRFHHGPSLPNPQVGGVLRGHEVLVTTFDRDRRVGALYRVAGGRAEYLAGGAAPGGEEPLLRQPEGVAVDPAGIIHVADRRRGRVIALDGDGRVTNPRVFGVARPRLLAREPDGALWVAADKDADAPWQRGTGEIWRVQQGDGTMVLRGPVPVGLAVLPGGGRLLVADRQEAELFVVDPDGGRRRLAKFSDGDAPRAVAFAPVTPETVRAGIAGDLFVVVIPRGTWAVNEVLRISGPFDRFSVRER